MSAFSENTYEQALIELFQSLEGKQYRYLYGPDIEREYSNPILDIAMKSRLLLHILKLSKESTLLSTLRDTLLPRLISGELKVNEITI